MKVDIGLITSEIHLPNLRIMENKLSNLCNIKYLVAEKNEDIKTHFINNFNSVDAFIFSGPVLHKYLLKNVKPFVKPCYVIYDDIAHVYKEILTIFMNNTNLQSNRVYIDFCSKETVLQFEGVFPKESTPYFFPWNSYDPDEYSKFVLENHLKLWREGKIDLSITRFGMLIDEFNKEGIKYHFIQPSVEYLTDLFLEVINDVKLNQLRKNKISAVFISPDLMSSKEMDNMERDIQLLTIQKELLEMIKDENFDFIVQKQDRNIEIFTTIEEVYRLTQEFRTCGLQNYLRKSIKTKFSVGYGSGKNITQAKNNALVALTKSLECGGSCSYYIGEDLSVTGPLTGNDELNSTYRSDPFTDDLAAKINLSPSYLHRIIAYAKKVNSNKLTSLELSRVLDVANRSSNRILNKLVEKEFASVNFEKKEASKGRPTKQYELLFLDSKGNVLSNI